MYICIYVYVYTIVCINHVKRVLNTLVEQNIYIYNYNSQIKLTQVSNY